MPMEKPLIGITCHYLDSNFLDTHPGIVTAGQDGSFLAGDYVYAIERAGGVPVILPQCEAPATLDPLLARLDGLLVSGGSDVDPALYGEEKKPCCGRISPARDAQDVYLARYALAHDLPMLGICRGIQVINVAAGGTLWQDVEQEAGFARHSGQIPRNLPRHTVRLSEGSKLRGIYGKETVAVNTFHHQAVRDVAPGFTVTAYSEDGVIEGIEPAGQTFSVALQWHPEKMFDSAEQMLLFCAFTKAARTARREKE